MELMYPVAIIISLLIALIVLFKNFHKKNKYTDGKKVANTKFVKETEYYKLKLRKYKILSNLVKALSVICIICSSILIARPITVQTKSEDKYNRDIIIGLDISISECEVNLELVRKFKEIIPDIEGDRIGIVLYNTNPIVYCPLTDDYNYVNERLSTIEEQLELVEANNGSVPFTFASDGGETFTFWYGGVVSNNEEKGSSLVGDGLARYNIFISKTERR